MKLIKKLLLTLVTGILCVALTGCGAQREEITTTINTFFTALTDGDWNTALSMCSEDVLAELDIMQGDNLEAYFYDSLGVDKEKISAEAQAAVSAFMDNITANMVQDYKINNIVVSKGEGTASVTVTAYDENASDPFSDPALEEKATSLMEAYTEENMDSLLQIYMTEGEEGMIIAMFNDLMPELLDAMSDVLTDLETTETTLYLKVIKVDDTWMITNPTKK